MPRPNSRAIAKLEEAAKFLDKQERRALTKGATFARSLCALLQTGKDIALTIANRTQTFKPCDIRVSRTRVSVGNTTFVLGSIQDNDEGGYEICDDNHDRTAISIAQA